jgi:hypothetical protein
MVRGVNKSNCSTVCCCSCLWKSVLYISDLRFRFTVTKMMATYRFYFDSLKEIKFISEMKLITSGKGSGEIDSTSTCIQCTT